MVAIVVVGAVFFGLLIYMKLMPEFHLLFNKKDVVFSEVVAENGESEIMLKDDKVDVDKLIPADISEVAVQNFIHQMSHQKIAAQPKWGMIPLTKARVIRLIDVIEANKSNYKKANTYLLILNRWYHDDFSIIDQDHNLIWNLQEGTIGRATGILSHEEEMEYIEQYYDLNE